MARNNDGTFTKVKNWIEEDANNKVFDGAALEADTVDLAQGIEESLDRLGRGSMQAQINMANNRIVELKNAETATDAMNYQSIKKMFNAFTFGTEYVDNGSNQASLTVKLKPVIANLILTEGDIISFIAPFTGTAENIIANKSYEKIEIEGFATPIPILRGAYTADSTFPDDIKDNKPSFTEGEKLTYEYVNINGTFYFRKLDFIERGEIIAFAKSAYTPAGYIDLSYNYKGYINMGFYNYLGAWLPTKTKSRNLGAKKGVLPEHTHTYSQVARANEAGTFNAGNDGIFTTSATSDVKGLVSANVVAGDKVEPLSNIIRYLQKI